MSGTVVNKPLVNTFGWLHVNGTAVEAPEERAGETAVVIGEGGEKTLVLEEASVLRAQLGKDAVLRLIQIRDGAGEAVGDIGRAHGGAAEIDDSVAAETGDGAAAAQISDIRVRCGENARFEWYRVVLGGGATYDNCSVELAGEGSSFVAEIGYRLAGGDRLDVNCEAIHTGKKTDSRIHASGVLSDRAFKLLRGTIDLRTGCSGAEGEETEEVLLMDDTVHNQSVPVILCAEEDVVGNHGASIGRLDENTVYYLESRGIPRDAVYEMMARARVDAVIRRIPDEVVRARLLGEEDRG